MDQVRRDNHVVPQFYLKGWSADDVRVWSYRTLVSSARVPEWDLRSIEHTAYFRDLYTVVENQEQRDDFERMLEAEYESPAHEAVEKVREDRPLNSNDWHHLVRFYAAQDVRTLASFIEWHRRMVKDLPPLMDGVLTGVVQELKRAKRERRPLRHSEPTFAQEIFKDSLRVKVERPANSRPIIRVESVVGRRFWLQCIRYALGHTARVLSHHKWGIASPSRLTTWFTSDHPAVRLNYYGPSKYDFGGGWGRKGGDLFIPLSPRHMLFTTIGQDVRERFSFDDEKTIELQRILAEHAHRWIFADEPKLKASWFRPRRVNAKAFAGEEAAARSWHAEQSAAEAS